MQLVHDDEPETERSTEPRYFDFQAELERRACDLSLPKSDRTRLRLLHGASQVLANTALGQLRVSQICRSANVAYGSFYYYFEDKDELVAELGALFLNEFSSAYEKIRGGKDHYWSILYATSFYIESFARNPGLLRAISNGMGESPALRDAAAATLNRWHDRVARSSPDAIGDRVLDSDDKRFVAHLVGGMLDSVMMQIFVTENSALLGWRNARAEMSELCALVWYRSIYGSDPDAAAVRDGRRKLRQLANG
jgi:AcrR family transcriptional regulator